MKKQINLYYRIRRKTEGFKTKDLKNTVRFKKQLKIQILKAPGWGSLLKLQNKC